MKSYKLSKWKLKRYAPAPSDTPVSVGLCEFSHAAWPVLEVLQPRVVCHHALFHLCNMRSHRMHF